MNWEGLILDEETGRFTLRFAGGECRDLYAQVKLQDGTCLKTTDMKLHKKRETEVTTEIGSCRRAEFVHEDGGRIQLIQQFDLYEEYMTIRLTANSPDTITTNCMTPVCGHGEQPVLSMEGEEIRFLSAPFDNDKWAKFVDYPVKYSSI